ncbi:Hypothetical predicted protein [Cloeon dipterum]|uniref:Peptidase S1 domain-containing protein n=1 Tax=Cloeon dipterum TaxID=197152 RepID=A0A8S1D967_9INSE|nr:Hypothetical predicted protein [Cloeon dipterum]
MPQIVSSEAKMNAHFLMLLVILSSELGVEACSRRRKGSRLAALAQEETCGCVPLRTCPPFLAALGTNVSRTRLRALQKATCDPIGDPDNPDVKCCDRFLKEIEMDNAVLEDKIPKRAKLVDFEKFCGQFERTLDPRIVGGKDAVLGQFPWIVRLGYTEEPGMDVDDAIFLCAGSLISHEHVLTAAHCVERQKHLTQVEWVLLGELDDRTDPDCEPLQGCAPPTLKRRIAWKVAHVEYSANTFKNDIGLIKLDKPVDFTNWVHPICLPKGPGADLANSKAVVAGWGRVEAALNGPPKYKNKLQYLWKRVLSVDTCGQQYKRSLGRGQLCAGGKIGEDSCDGDSGGPLARPDPADPVGPYTLVGVVSFGAKDCGLGTLPGVYTRIDTYLDWIARVAAADPKNMSATIRM